MSEYIKDTVKMFGPESAYNEPNPTSRSDWPKKGPWINKCLTQSMDKLIAGEEAGGIDFADSDSYPKVVPLVARYTGSKDLMSMVERVVRLTLNNDKSVRTAQAGARLLEHLILHGPSENYVSEWMKGLDSELRSEVEAVLAARDLPPMKACARFGLACYLPGNFQNALHCVVTNNDYVTGVRNALRYGGAICARTCFIGACLGAQSGFESIPEEWINKTTRGKEICELADQLVADC